MTSVYSHEKQTNQRVYEIDKSFRKFNFILLYKYITYYLLVYKSNFLYQIGTSVIL